VVERRNPFAAWTQPSPAKALAQAERDLEAARQRASVDDDDDRKKERLAKWERQGVLDERERIKTILTSPVAARQPHLADTFAFQSDIPAAKAIAAMEAQAPRAAAAQRTSKETADLIVLAGQRARGLVPCEVMAGPKVFVRMTPEEIIAAAKKARSQD
jgi:predicted RNA-binding Zn ribbon-like protein